MFPDTIHNCVNVREGVEFCYPTAQEGRYFISVDSSRYPDPAAGPDIYRFLNGDWKLAEAYFRASSLSSQYQAIDDTFNPPPVRPDKKYEKELRRRHYLKLDKSIADEIYFHLTARGLPRKGWAKIAKTIIRELMSRPVDRPIPFSQIIDDTLQRQLGE